MSVLRSTIKTIGTKLRKMFTPEQEDQYELTPYQTRLEGFTPSVGASWSNCMLWAIQYWLTNGGTLIVIVMRWRLWLEGVPMHWAVYTQSDELIHSFGGNRFWLDSLPTKHLFRRSEILASVWYKGRPHVQTWDDFWTTYSQGISGYLALVRAEGADESSVKRSTKQIQEEVQC